MAAQSAAPVLLKYRTKNDQDIEKINFIESLGDLLPDQKNTIEELLNTKRGEASIEQIDD
jgi:hypothetical protein